VKQWLLLLGLLVLTLANGTPVWIDGDQIVAVFTMTNVGAASTVVVTAAGGPFYVRERAEDVARKLGWKNADE
jgi:hypothetical protein